MRSFVLYLLAVIAISHFGSGEFARADDLQYLDHSELALARLYNDIQNATSTLDLTYLIWDPCSTAGKVITHLLAEKAHPKDPKQKPVKVRVLLDSYFQKDKLGAMQYEFGKSGIDLKFFNGQLPVANLHTHSKLTLVDKDVPGKARMVAGGRNIADEYYGMAAKNYVDRDVGVTGPSTAEDSNGAIAQAKRGFDGLWSNPRAKHVGMPSAGEVARLEKCMKWNAKDASLDQYLKKNAATILAQEKPVRCQQVSYTLDDMHYANSAIATGVGKTPLVGPVFKAITESPIGHPISAVSRKIETVTKRLFGSSVLDDKPTSKAVYDLVKGARNSLTMENQYFIPDDLYLKPLLKEKKRQPGFTSDVYSNMFDKNSGIESVFDKDFDMVNYWQLVDMQRLNGGGEANHMSFRVAGAMDKWRYSPAYTEYRYHAKTFVADHKDAIVSSFNIDPRSMSLNGESALSVRNCPVFAQKVENMSRLTGKVWEMEEQLQVCLTGHRPLPPTMDPLTVMLEFFTKGLQ
jgi:phosphatidylserine/phosphatidylglycerophosphate/cardiolipin synthase-like enzyme